MGNSNSKSKLSCISYEVAIQRVTELEFKRIKDAFKKTTRPNLYLSKNAFQTQICEGFPEEITELLYAACTNGKNSNKGIIFKDLFCLLVLLTRGEEDEKIRFLWNLYCNDSGTYILKQDYSKYLSLESRDAPSNPNYSNLVYSLFSQTDKINFEQFKLWITTHKTSTLTSQWLLSKTSINLTSEIETPTFYQSLAGVTHLEEQEICELEKEFWRLKNNSKNGQLDLELLGPLLSPPIPKAALYGLFNAFDENRDGHIDFKELCCGVSASCKGPNVERSKFCFKIFDLDRDGTLNSIELNQMVEVLLFVAKESKNNLSMYDSMNKNVIFKDLIKFTQKTADSDNLEEINLNLTQEDFMMWNVDSTLNLVQPFLDLTFEICHIVFGLKPECSHIEYEIVKGWLKREERRGYKVGQFWYLICKDWWNVWSQVSSNCSLNCKNSTLSKNINGIDEAIVCDENLYEINNELLTNTETSSLGSTSSSISFGRQKFLQPGHIDNSNLIGQNLYKEVRTLTGEGGHLKKDTPLVQGHDFELVPKSLWEALARWYGYIVPLPRQVIKPANAPIELELYPLNLRILLHQNNLMNVNQPPAAWTAISSGYGALSSASLVTPNILPPKRYLAYTAAFSRLANLKLVGEFLCENLKLRYEDIRLWYIPNSQSSEDCPILLEEENLTLSEYFIRDNDQLLLERRNQDLTWPEELGSLSQRTNYSQDRRLTRASIYSIHVQGATGLHNLGNTCFINAALQVLFNTKPLTQYFKKNLHLYELNPGNKLSTTKGQLSTRYGELLKEIWTTNARSVAPLKLRFCINKFAPQFAGGGQHDSQELLEWMLDALHEDLNRVNERPYIELKDSNGRPDEIVQNEAWQAFQGRNQSIITDLFYGQLKSKVSCECCGKESVRFDPFSLLSLPLPLENYLYLEILVLLLDGSEPIKYGLKINSDCTYFDIKKRLAEISETHLHPSLILLCELSNYQIKSILLDDQKINKINNIKSDYEIYAYELPEADESRSRGSSILGLNIEKGLKDIQRSSNLLLNQDCSSNQQIFQELSNSESNDNSLYSQNSINKPTSKVRRCFGNNNCMSQALLCFNKTPELSKSPENTFVLNKNKTITTTDVPTSSFFNNNFTETPFYTKNPLDFREQDGKEMPDDNGDINAKCRCKSPSENSENNTNHNSMQMEMNLNNRKSGRRNSTHKIGKYLIAIHRKVTRQDIYFLSYNKTRSSLFGIPILIPCYEGNTNKDLYCAVWVQVSRLLSPIPTERGNHATDCDDSLGYDFPFTLRSVTYDGKMCAICPWTNFCRGCDILFNDDFILHDAFSSPSESSSNSSTPKLSNRISTNELNDLNNSKGNKSIYIAIDWDPTALHLRYSTTREKLWRDHESIFKCRRELNAPIDLNDCLEAFTSEEKLEEWYHCGHCLGKKPATKKLQIWKLPPILIIHLKRFNFVGNKWVKSNVHVNFPFELYPTQFLASIPQETILRYMDLKFNNNKGNFEEIDDNYDSSNSQYCDENEEQTNSSSSSSSIRKNNEITSIIHSNNKIDSTESSNNLPKNKIKRKRLVSSSLSKSPISDDYFKDFHQHKLKCDSDSFDLKYRLYAVVSHSGMLNGGHYTSYATNPNGHWYYYNDSSCRELLNRPNIDPSSAYLLFYERENLDYDPYLPNCEGKNISDQNFEFDDCDNDNKMCSIS